MRILISAALYLIAGLLLSPNRGASIASAVIFGFAVFGASRLSRVTSSREFAAWGRRNPVECLLTLGLPVAFVVISDMNAGEPIQVALSLPVVFAWFWLFAALGTNLKERRLKKAVEEELARRDPVKERADAL